MSLTVESLTEVFEEIKDLPCVKFLKKVEQIEKFLEIKSLKYWIEGQKEGTSTFLMFFVMWIGSGIVFIMYDKLFQITVSLLEFMAGTMFVCLSLFIFFVPKYTKTERLILNRIKTATYNKENNKEKLEQIQRIEKLKNLIKD